MGHKMPPLLSPVFRQMHLIQDAMFVFIDKKAAITYYGQPFNSVVYFVGDFKGNKHDVTAELHRAAASMLN